MALSLEEKESLRITNRAFWASLAIGALALAYWLESAAAVVVVLSAGIALTALANGIASRLYTITELLEKILVQIAELRNRK